MSRPIAAIAGALSVALLLGGCSTGTGQDGGTGGVNDKTKTTLTLWSFFTGREKGIVDTRLAAFHKKYPWITVKHTGGESDDNLVQAVRGGNAPDVDLSQNSDAVAGYCATGVFQDLTKRITASAAAKTILPGTKPYTTYAGKQCALPMLTDTYGLYYNSKMFKAAGITAPPKTWDELAADAKKLTVRDPDGTIKVAGFVPLLDFGENNVTTVTPGWDLTWYKGGKSTVSTDPQWSAMLKWQKDLVDWYGYDNLKKFVASTGEEFSAENPFQKEKLAMAIDGEWRVAFAADQAPGLQYKTAPTPAVTAANYGAGLLGGTTVGIPKGTKHADAAWLLTQYLGTDTANLVDLTLKLRNVPTTTTSLADPAVRGNVAFDTMLDIAANPKTKAIEGTPAGSAPRELLNQFVQRWQAGKANDLTGGLASVAKQIDSQIAQAGAGTAP